MTTPAQLIAAARLVDKGWAQCNGINWPDKYCPVTAVITVLDGRGGNLSDFEINTPWHNDAPDCTKDGAVMFLLLAAEARRCGDL